MNLRAISLLVALSVTGPAFADDHPMAAVAEALVGDDAMARRRASRVACLHPLDADALLPALTKASGDADPVVALRCRATVRLMQTARSDGLPDLRRRLRSGATEARITALAEARTLGAAAAPAIAELVAALGSERREIRDEAAAALGDIGPEAADAVPALITVYEATRGSYVVTQALDGIGTGLVAATPLLLEEMKSTSASVREAVVQRIGKNGPAGPEVVSMVRGLLHDENAGLRACAMFVLEETAPTNPATLGALVAGAEDGAPQVRALAVRSLGKLGAFASATAPTVTRALADPSVDVRREAAKSLSQVLPRDAGAPAELVALLSESDESVLAAALESLARLGPPASSLAALRAIESRGDYVMSGLARVARWRAGDGDVATIASVVRDSPEFQTEAADRLLQMARSSDVPLGAMLAARRTFRGTRELDAALRAVGPNAATPANLDALVAQARDADRFDAEFALRLLAQIGPSAAPAAPRLVEILRSSSDGRGPAVASALGAIGPDAAQVAVPALLDAFAAPYFDMMGPACADALSHLGAAALPHLLAILASAPAVTGDERWPPTPAALAARALGGMGAHARTAVPVLVARARAGDFAAVEALGRLGGTLEAMATPLAELFERTDDELPTKDALSFRVELVRAFGGMKAARSGRVGRALATALQSEHPLLRVRAAEAQLRLSGVTAAKDERLDLLIEALRSDVSEPAAVFDSGGPGLGLAREPAVYHPIRQAAAEALSAIGPGAARAAPELIARWLDEDEDVLTRQAAYAALWRIFGD